ncbi:hypothetical protein INR49_003797, partial [Caranx melampygus]
MTDGALRLCLLLALQLRCVTPLAIPRDRSATAARRDGSDETKRVGEKPDAPLHLRDLPRGPEVAPHKKAPQFIHGRDPKSQKEILEGNIVRSFEDKGHAGERFHFFNLSSFGREERMIKAEFRWFRKKQKFYLGKSHGPHFYKVDLYEVLDSRVKPWRGNLITSRLVPLYTQGWEVFNDKLNLQQQQQQQQQYLSIMTTAAEGDAHLQGSYPTATPSPASGFPSSLTLRRSAGRAGSSLPWIQRLPLQRLLSLPAGRQPQSDQPRH